MHTQLCSVWQLQTWVIFLVAPLPPVNLTRVPNGGSPVLIVMWKLSDQSVQEMLVFKLCYKNSTCVMDKVLSLEKNTFRTGYVEPGSYQVFMYAISNGTLSQRSNLLELVVGKTY